MNALAGWMLLLALGGAVWWYGTPHSPENVEGARGWLSVLRVRFASGSFASWFASLLAPRDDECEPLTWTQDGTPPWRGWCDSEVVVASEYRQIGRPTLKNPPVKVDEHKNTRQRMAAWIEEAHDAGGMTSAQIKREAARRFGTSLRLAQLAAQDAGLGRRKKR